MKFVAEKALTGRPLRLRPSIFIGAQCCSSDGAPGCRKSTRLRRETLRPFNLWLGFALAALPLCLVTACKEQHPRSLEQTAPPKHEHIPPHHGTPIVLGNEEYHVELLLDRSAGKFQAYILDGELENFIRLQQSAFAVSVKALNREALLTFKAVANNATGETVGNTSLFEADADWLRTVPTFDAVIKELQIRDRTYQDISFNFPKGNDSNEK